MAVQTISAFGLAAQITDNSTSFDRYEQTGETLAKVNRI